MILIGASMIENEPIRRTGSGRPAFEGPTWLVLAGCYVLWFLTLWFAPELGLLAVVPLAIAIAQHSSLQHEILHGHPTRNALLNEALVFLPVGLFVPYRRFRDLHLTHHNDARLTDPYDDPESFYLSDPDHQRQCRASCALLAFNATFAGRVLIGPALALYAFWSCELRLMASGHSRVIGAWSRWLAGTVPVALAVYASGISPLIYLLACYVGFALIMVRSFIEHRAAEVQDERTAVVEAHWFWQLLFLNNNYHLLHHDNPSLAWYLLPAKWRDAREHYAKRNGGYVLPGYGHVARRWLFRRREPYVHPLHVEQNTRPSA